MADRSSKAFDVPATAAAPVAGLRLAPQMLIMFRAFWASPQRTKILLLGVALVVVIGATAFGQIRLNAWNRPFYDALARKDLGDFLDQIMVFGVIAGGLLVLNVAQAWLNQIPNSGCAEASCATCSRSGLSLGAPFTWPIPARWAPTPTSESTRTPAI